MIPTSLNSSKRASHFCLFCGRKVSPRRKVFHVAKANHDNHLRCFSTKIIRGSSNGDKCDIKYKNSAVRNIRDAIESANSLNNSMASYLLFAMRRAATLNGGSIFYFRQNVPTSTGSISTATQITSSESNHISKKESSHSFNQQYVLWSTVKVKGYLSIHSEINLMSVILINSSNIILYFLRTMQNIYENLPPANLEQCRRWVDMSLIWQEISSIQSTCAKRWSKPECK